MSRKCLIRITIACGLALAILFGFKNKPTYTQPQGKTARERRTTFDPTRRTQTRVQVTKRHFQVAELYRTIIDNNLFRPLGWRPPKEKSAYRLLGTIVPKDAHAAPQAILQATASNKHNTDRHRRRHTLKRCHGILHPTETGRSCFIRYAEISQTQCPTVAE